MRLRSVYGTGGSPHTIEMEHLVNTSHARVGSIPILLSVVGCFAGAADAQSDAYHILVTNDDGIESPGIEVLAEALRAVGQVHVVAPCGQRSGASMSIALRDELHLRSVRGEGLSHEIGR